MADVMSAMQAAGNSSPAGVDIGAALQAAGADTPATPMSAPTAGDRASHGFADTFYGLGRVAQHLMPDAVLNGIRQGISSGLNAVGAPEAASLFSPVSTQQFDGMVAQRAQQYQQARAQNGQTGIDWWRLAGNAANPTNYLSPGGAAGSVAGRIGQAAMQGGAISGVQAAAESTDPNSFWWDTAKGTAVGTAAGAALGSLVETALPALRWGLSKARSLVGDGTGPQVVGSPTVPMAADAIVKQALQGAGTDPATVNLNLLSGMRQDVQSALEHGADISPAAIVNRARAESLPVPVQLTRGQATGDAMLFAREQNLRGITGVGEPITQRLTDQNAAFIGNLDALGAKNAPDTVSTGQMYAAKLQQAWDAMQAQKDALYAKVRNSQGQSAAMDGVSAAENIKATLDSPQASHAYDLLPGNIQKTIDSLQWGDMPLTVSQWQSLDKIWGQAQRGTSDGSVAYAIGQARQMLSDAPIADDVGAEAKQAYQAAKQAHAQQMSLVDPKLPNGTPNPQYQPLMKAVVMDGKGDTLFNDGFLNAAPTQAAKNLQFLSQIDPNAPQTIGSTLMGEIKRQALSSASDGRGTVSEAVLRGWANDPVKSARLSALMPKPAVDTFGNLAATVEAAKKIPAGSAVNTSNSGSAVVNAGVSMLKNSAVAQIAKRVPGLSSVAEGLEAAQRATDVGASLNPGVTLTSLMSATPVQAARRHLITRALAPAAAAGGVQASQQAAQGPQD